MAKLWNYECRICSSNYNNKPLDKHFFINFNKWQEEIKQEQEYRAKEQKNVDFVKKNRFLKKEQKMVSLNMKNVNNSGIKSNVLFPNVSYEMRIYK